MIRLLTAVLLFASFDVAAEVSLTPLSNNTPADADDVMGNFNALRDAIPTTNTILSAVSEAGVGTITNGLITTEFTSAFSSNAVAIPDFDPSGIVSQIVVPTSVGAVDSLSVTLNLQNFDISGVSAVLTAPDGAQYVLTENGAGSGSSINTTYPIPTPPVSGDLTTWVGADPSGTWTLRVEDHFFNNTGVDGQFAWSILVTGKSSTSATVNGTLAVTGDLTVGGNAAFRLSGAITMIDRWYSNGESSSNQNMVFVQDSDSMRGGMRGDGNQMAFTAGTGSGHGFSFPETGIYRVDATMRARSAGHVPQTSYVRAQVTEDDGSTWAQQGYLSFFETLGYNTAEEPVWFSASASFTLNISDTALQRLRFEYNEGHSFGYLQGGDELSWVIITRIEP